MATRTARRRTDARQRVVLQWNVAARAHAPQLRRWVRSALHPGSRADITVRVVGAAEARRLNRRYRARDYATNVLSFPYSRRPLCGDIVLCLPVLVKEARAQHKPLAAHFAHLVVHGVLHLRGFDHLRKSDAARMEARERVVLARLGIADPYSFE